MKTLTEPVLLSLLILIAGCSDKDIIKGIDVSGYVFEYGTLDPIEGARVYLVTGSSGNWGTTDTLVTGPDGRYAFRHPQREPGTLVALYVFADDYYDILEEAVLYPWKKQEIDIVMDPYAWIKLHIKNTNPYDINDLFSFSGEWGGGSLPDYYGMNVDCTIYKRYMEIDSLTYTGVLQKITILIFLKTPYSLSLTIPWILKYSIKSSEDLALVRSKRSYHENTDFPGSGSPAHSYLWLR